MSLKEYADTTARPSPKETAARSRLEELFRNAPMPEGELLDNLGLFIRRQNLTKILLMHELYKKILNVHGIVAEFGTRWGQNLALFESFRGIYEPYNHNRKIVGFDTFSGFASLSEKDRNDPLVFEGNMSVPQGYERYLSDILNYHEQESPIPHITKYQLIKGDAVKTAPEYFEARPETIVAFAYFDLDLYEPTRACLETIKPHVTKGTVIAFDELNCSHFPGETLALREVFGLDRFSIQRPGLGTLESYIVIE